MYSDVFTKARIASLIASTAHTDYGIAQTEIPQSEEVTGVYNLEHYLTLLIGYILDGLDHKSSFFARSQTLTGVRIVARSD